MAKEAKKKKPIFNTRDVLDEIEKETRTKTKFEFCTYFFELKDKKKINARLQEGNLYENNGKYYSLCKNKAETGENKCKKHMVAEILITKESLRLIPKDDEIDSTKDISNHVLIVNVSPFLKTRAEKILNSLLKQVVPEKKLEKYDFSEITQKPRITEPVHGPKPPSETPVQPIEIKYETESDNEETDDEDSLEIEELECLDGSTIMVDSNLNLIELDDEGFGVIVGKLEKTIKKSERKVVYNGIDYKILVSK